MRAVAIIFFIGVITYCDAARGLPVRNIVKNINNIINKSCNNKALSMTNNTDMYNCITVNNTNNCKYITNYTEFINVKNNCVDEKNAEVGSGVFISILGWTIFLMLLQCHK